MKANIDGVTVKVTNLVEGQEWPRGVKLGNALVKVYQRKRADGSYGFEVADYSTGARRLRSCKSEEVALKTATRIAKQLASGDVEAASMSNAQAASFGRAVEFLRPTGVCLEVACAHFAEAYELFGADRIVEAARHLKEHNPDNLTPKTVSEAAEELLKAKEAEWKAGELERNTLDDLRARLRRFAKSFAMPVSSVTTADFTKWLDKMPRSNRTKINYRTKVGQLFNFCEARGYIRRNSNPVEGMEKIRAKRQRIQIYTPTEIDRLLNAATPEFQPCVAIGAFAGLRSSEIQRLDWEHIDFTKGHILASAKKVGTPSRRFVPISANLRKWLEPHAKKSGLVWLPDVANRQRAEEYFGDAQAATSAATADEEKKIAPVPWKHNGLRHSFGSYRMAELQDENQTALEMGDRPKTVHEFYRELVAAEDAAKWFAVAPKQAEGKVIQLAAATATK